MVKEVEPQLIEKVVPLKQNTYKPKANKIAKFNNIYSHNWDFEELEQLEENYINEQLNSMSLTSKGQALINRIGKNYNEEPTEWQGIKQLAFRG